MIFHPSKLYIHHPSWIRGSETFQIDLLNPILAQTAKYMEAETKLKWWSVKGISAWLVDQTSP